MNNLGTCAASKRKDENSHENNMRMQITGEYRMLRGIGGGCKKI
jgi:hypothetical protein